MILCIIIILVILIILAIGWFMYQQHTKKNNMPWNLLNKGQFTANPNMISPNSNLLSGSSGIINNSSDIPSQFLPQNAQRRAIIGNNIQNLQGKVDKEYYGYYLPENGGENIQLPYKATCTGYGEDATCKKTYGKISTGNSTSVSAGKIASAEQEMWMAGRFDGSIQMDDSLGSSASSNTATPSGDYNSYLEHLVADNRLRDNHSKWVNEMSPWSGTAQSVDNIDEAVSNSLSWQGLRRPQSIVQDSNALFKTEIDASDLINNLKFRFNT